MGPNGSGKSTLSKVIAGHPGYEVTAGQVLFRGEDLLDLEPDERSRAGVFLAFQYPAEIPGVSIANFLRTASNARLAPGEEMDIFAFQRRLTEKMEMLKMDASFRDAVGASADPQGGPDRDAIEARHEKYREAMWEALRKLDCPTLVVRGAASDFLNADIADRMVEDELSRGELAVVAQAGHSVMTDNPEGFAEAVGRFVLGE